MPLRSDFCYFTNLLCVVAYLWPSPVLRRLCFVYANGPLAWAIAAWRNALVFHSLDKTTSIFIHAFPALLTFTWRWELTHADSGASVLCDAAAPACTLGPATALALPLLGCAAASPKTPAGSRAFS